VVERKPEESAPVKAAPDAFVEAVEPYVSAPIWGAIQMQRFTGMRPGEVLAMRGCDLNTTGNVWEYRPASHKTQHFDKDRVVFIGPRAQAVLREFLKPDLAAYLFSPRDGREAYIRANYRAGASAQRNGKRLPRARYSVTSYHGAIRSACIRAGVPGWSPNCLRHNAASFLRREVGIEAAQLLLGHSHPNTTLIYAEASAEKAREIAGRVG
jgi:integrase